MRSAALALLVLISSQAVSATHILAGKALVKGIAGILTELPVNFTQESAAVSTVPANFSVGASTGNLFCLPSYYAREIEVATLTCPDGYNANDTNAIGGIACIKQAYVENQNCFRSMQCPANGQNMQAGELCLPSEVRSALIGMMVVFKVKAMLPFTILPILRTALIKAVTLPIVLPAKLIGAQVTGAAKVANAVLNQTASGTGLGRMDLGGLGVAAAAGGFAGVGNKSSSSLPELLAQLEMMKPNPAAVLASLGLASGAAGSFGGLGNKGNSSLPELLAQLEMLMPNPAAALAALGLGGSTTGSFMGLGDKGNSSLPELLAQLNMLLPNPAATLAGLGVGGSTVGSFMGLGDKGNSSSLPELLAQLEMLKPNPAAALAAVGLGSGAAGSFGGKGNSTSLPELLAQLEMLMPNPAAALASLGLAAGSFGGLGGKGNSSLPELLAQLVMSNPAAALAGLAVGGSTAGIFGGLGGKGNSSSLPDLLAQLEMMKPNPAAALAALSLGGGVPGSFGGLGNKENSSIPQLFAQMPQPQLQIPKLFNQSTSMGASGPAAAMTTDIGMLLAATQLAAMQKGSANMTAGGSGAKNTFGGLTDKEAQVSLLLSQLAQLQKFNQSSGLAGLGFSTGLNLNAAGPGAGLAGVAGGDKDLTTLMALLSKQKTGNKSLGLSSMRLAAANSFGSFGAGFADKNSSSGLMQLLEGLKPNAVAMLASLIGSGSTGGFAGFADQGSNASSVVQLLTQLEMLKPNPAALLTALTDKNGMLQLAEQLEQMPVLNPAGALAALGLGGFGDKNFTLPQLLSQFEGLKPNPAAILAGLAGSAASSFGGFGGGLNSTLPLLQLALQKPNPLAILEALGGGFGGFGGDKNNSMPLLLQLALQMQKPLAILEALGSLQGSPFGGFGGFGGDKNFSMPLLAQLQKFNVSLPGLFPGLSMSSMTVVPEVSITFGGGNASFPASLVRQAASLTFAGGDVVGALMQGADPMEIFTKCLLNINVNEIMNFVPQINSWVSEHLQNLTHVNEITAQISANFPDCIYRCCKKQQTLETSIAVPTLACNPGLQLNPITKLCIGQSAGYGQCPSYMSKCPASLPSGQPICVSELDSFGLDTCKVLVLAHHTLPQRQCPA